jgi:hypothetical protein
MASIVAQQLDEADAVADGILPSREKAKLEMG